MEERTDKDADYVWRFRLPADTDAPDDTLADMVRCFVEGFLEIGCFTQNGKSVQVDGFRLNDRKGIIALAVEKGG